MEQNDYNYTNTNSIDDDPVLGLSVPGISDENGTADSSAAVSSDDNMDQENIRDDNIDSESDINYTDILVSMDQNIESLYAKVETLTLDLSDYCNSHNEIITSILLVMIGYVVISVFRKVFDAFH